MTTPQPRSSLENIMNTMTTYTTDGEVCGGCGHSHRSLRTAQACADRHHAAVVKGNGPHAYSDRRVMGRVGGRQLRPLTEDEREELWALTTDEARSAC